MIIYSIESPTDMDKVIVVANTEKEAIKTALNAIDPERIDRWDNPDVAELGLYTNNPLRTNPFIVCKGS